MEVRLRAVRPRNGTRGKRRIWSKPSIFVQLREDFRDLRQEIRSKFGLLDRRDGGKAVYAETTAEIETRKQLAIKVERSASAGLPDLHHPVLRAIISRRHYRVPAMRMGI